MKGDFFAIHFFDGNLSTSFDVDSFINFTKRTLADAVLFGVLVISEKDLNLRFHLECLELLLLLLIFITL